MSLIKQKTPLSLTVIICCMLTASCGAAGPVTKRRAEAYANKVNLRALDVPKMRILLNGFETTNGPPFGNCASRVDHSDEIVAVESPWLRRSVGAITGKVGLTMPRPPVEGVHSVVYVMREASVTSHNVAAMRDLRALGCVERLRLMDTRDAAVGGKRHKRDIQVSRLPFPLSGVLGYGLRVSGTVAGASYHQKKRLVFYEDTWGFAVGAAEIVLHADGVSRPVPSTEERRLLTRLYSRANGANGA